MLIIFYPFIFCRYPSGWKTFKEKSRTPISSVHSSQSESVPQSTLFCPEPSFRFQFRKTPPRSPAGQRGLQKRRYHPHTRRSRQLQQSHSTQSESRSRATCPRVHVHQRQIQEHRGRYRNRTWSSCATRFLSLQSVCHQAWIAVEISCGPGNRRWTDRAFH